MKPKVAARTTPLESTLKLISNHNELREELKDYPNMIVEMGGDCLLVNSCNKVLWGVGGGPAPDYQSDCRHALLIREGHNNGSS